MTETDTARTPPAQPEPAPSPPNRPRTRWAAIIWGALLAATAIIGIWMLGTSDRREQIVDALVQLTPLSMTASALLALGVLALVIGLVGVARRIQRRHEPDQGQPG